MQLGQFTRSRAATAVAHGSRRMTRCGMKRCRAPDHRASKAKRAMPRPASALAERRAQRSRPIKPPARTGPPADPGRPPRGGRSEAGDVKVVVASVMQLDAALGDQVVVHARPPRVRG